jgi:hypothetical protein
VQCVQHILEHIIMFDGKRRVGLAVDPVRHALFVSRRYAQGLTRGGLAWQWSTCVGEILSV